MPSFRTGTVTTILSERPGIQRIEVDGERAYVLTQLIGPVAEGDEVVMNTTAVELGLGTGGWHVVHWNLSRREWSEPGAGHEMKLRYTSLQIDTGITVAEPQPKHRPSLPVVACFLHSQVACVARVFKERAPDRRLAYVMTDAGALSIALSDLVAELQADGLVDTTVTCGQAFGGDREAVSIFDAIGMTMDHDAAVVGMGPGSLGTGMPAGFSGMDVVSVINAAAKGPHLAPIVALRYSEADTRERHHGLSHHTLGVLLTVSEEAVAPIPRGEPHPDLGGRHRIVEVDVPDVSNWPYTSMGRTVAEDPKFFQYAAAAGVYAANLLIGSNQ